MRRNRDFGNHKPMTGPLMTSHLRDLDIELELLKRKREIIQQEQNMLSRLSRQNNYEQPPNSYNRHEHGQYEPQQLNISNFSNPYDVPGGSRSFRQQGFKRPPQSHWQAPIPPKRFSGPRMINPWQNDNLNEQAQSRKAFPPSKPRFSQPVPLMSLKPGIGQRIKKDNRHQPRRDFQPNKVTKPIVQPAKSMKSKDNQSKAKPKSQSGPVMKLAICPPVEVKKLICETMKALEPQVDDQILHADRQPSLQMKGRMELALGSILKEMRQEYCTDPDASEYFVTQFIQRIIKQTIRLRIRDVMMGKVIGAVSDILENYRKTYPKETDIEILNIVRDAQTYSSKNLSVTHLIESDDPLDFFRKNMQRVLSFKLEELFSSLQTFYENKDIQIIDSINKLPEPQTLDPDKTDETKEEEKKTMTNEKANLYQIINSFFDSVPSNNEFVKALGGRLDKAKHYIDFMDKLLEERLPKVLPKFRDVILNILYSDKEFFGTKAMIMTEMKKKVKDIITDEAELKKVEPKKKDKSEVSEEKIEEENKSTQPPKLGIGPIDETPTVPVIEPLYYVKLLGRPNLPARAVIYEFLNQFNPKSIKKHKSVNNLLVVAFDNKEYFNKILDANESVVGDATIIIRASEQINGNKETPLENKTEIENSEKISNTSLDENILSSDLDNQITDLLSSIRKADEEETEETNEVDITLKNVPESSDKVDVIPDKVDKVSDNAAKVAAEADDITDKVDEAIVRIETGDNERIDSGDKESSQDEKSTMSDEEILGKIEDIIKDASGSKNIGKQDDEANKEVEKVPESNETESDKLQKLEDLKANIKESGRSTPTRASSRLPSTPSTVRTRRANRLAQNNTQIN